MKVLLVGGLGFVGKRFIRKFSDAYEIIVYTRHENSLRFSESIGLKKITIEKGGIEDANISDVIARHRPDVVVHLAALTGIKKCHENPDEAFRVNVYGTYNLVKACSNARSRLIFISSREVYGETLNQESKEDDPPNPNNVYGITKMLGEILIKQQSLKNNLDYTILRLSNVYGPEGDQYGAQIIIRDAIKLHKIKILGGKQKLNYVYVDDVVDLINLILHDKRASNQVFNVGSKDTITIEEFVTKVIKSTGEKVKVEYFPMRETETTHFIPSLAKLEKILGFYPRTSLETGLQKTIEWYSKY